MITSLNGLQETVATFAADTALAAGIPVKLSANQTAAACAGSDLFAGIALQCRNGMVSVQLKGYVRVPYSGTAPALGWKQLAADGAGKVKTGTAGNFYLVTDVDTATATVGFML